MDKEFDILFSEVVKKSTCGIFVKYGHTDGIIEFDSPVFVSKEYYRPFEFEYPMEELCITGVDCDTGELITKEGRFLRYNQLSQREMEYIHSRVIHEQYKFITNQNQLV